MKLTYYIACSQDQTTKLHRIEEKHVQNSLKILFHASRSNKVILVLKQAKVILV